MTGSALAFNPTGPRVYQKGLPVLANRQETEVLRYFCPAFSGLPSFSHNPLQTQTYDFWLQIHLHDYDNRH